MPNDGRHFLGEPTDGILDMEPGRILGAYDLVHASGER